MKKILITGASGFIGQRFLEYNKERYEMRSISLRNRKVGELDLRGYDVILHLAGIAHQLNEESGHKYDKINYTLTKELSIIAADQGIGHFIHMSTIKVFGNNSNSIDKDTLRKPDGDPYGESKLKAELHLESIISEEMKVSILRPPLVYGPGVKANMLNLMKLCQRNVVLPFKGIKNKRTMVFIDNLIEMINIIIEKEATGTFMAGDKEPLSTTWLIRQIRKSMGNSENLITMPAPLRFMLKKLKPGLYSRLFMNLEVDVSNSFSRLEYTPPFTSEEGIHKMVDWFLNKAA